MIRIGGGGGYPLLAEDKIAPPVSMIYGGTTSQTGGVSTLDEHYRNVGWCRGFDEFTETFDSLDPAWDVSGLASAVISGGKLVTEAKLDTLNTIPRPGASLNIPPIYGDFEISADLTWSTTGDKNAMGRGLLILNDAAMKGILDIGIQDGWAAQYPTYAINCGGQSYIPGYNTVGKNGNTFLNVSRISGEINLYFDNVLRLTAPNITTPVCNITLANVRYSSSYPGYTVSWDNLYVKRRR